MTKSFICKEAKFFIMKNLNFIEHYQFNLLNFLHTKESQRFMQAQKLQFAFEVQSNGFLFRKDKHAWNIKPLTTN